MLRCVHTRILVIALLGVVVACEDATPGDAAAPVKSEASKIKTRKTKSKRRAPARPRRNPIHL